MLIFCADSDAESEEEDAGDLGVGSGDISTKLHTIPVDKFGAPRSKSFVDDLPKKPSRWTRAFLKTQGDSALAYAPFQWTKYHKKCVNCIANHIFYLLYMQLPCLQTISKRICE